MRRPVNFVPAARLSLLALALCAYAVPCQAGVISVSVTGDFKSGITEIKIKGDDGTFPNKFVQI